MRDILNKIKEQQHVKNLKIKVEILPEIVLFGIRTLCASLKILVKS